MVRRVGVSSQRKTQPKFDLKDSLNCLVLAQVSQMDLITASKSNYSLEQKASL